MNLTKVFIRRKQNMTYKETTEKLRRMPLITFKARKSEDGKYVIHQTIFTDIKPLKYYEKVVTQEPGDL
jgi:hypothetical protein